MKYKHEITISPDTVQGERGWWSVSVDGKYDGSGRSIEEALCATIENLAEELAAYGA